jgi:NTP pyrophosphatase (non-canonical NTP hydrolase)
MELSSYQKNITATATYPRELEGGVFYTALGLAGEVGELLNKVKKVARDNAKIDKEDLASEIGDILWYLSQLSTELGIDMDYVAEHNLEKVKSRKERGMIGGSGDNR